MSTNFSAQMKECMIVLLLGLIIGSFTFPRAYGESSGQPDLPTWNEGPAKQGIIDFVKAVTDKGSGNYVPPEERIATFDNDGTLICEKPCYVQMQFLRDRVRELAKDHPEYKTKEPFRAVMDGDLNAMASLGSRGAIELMGACNSGMTTDQFDQIVKSWIATARHPRYKQPYTDCVYQPMLEVLAYLRKNGFKTYIVSGGGQEFMRPWTEKVYGVPPEQVSGSNCKLKYRTVDGKPELERLSEPEFVCDGDKKPVAIQHMIGRRPIVAFGNSDGDLAMLQWTTGGPGRRSAVLIHHTDSLQEYAYDRDSRVGHLDKALDEAQSKHWIVVDMKTDWKRVFPFEN